MSAPTTAPAKPAAHRLIAVVLVLQGLTILGQWLGVPSATAPAVAQIPDAGGQRIQIIDELRSLNSKVDKLLTLLDSGKLEVRVAAPDEKK